MNDPRIAATLTEKFIPVSAGIERLQPSRYGNPETKSSQWFQPMAKKALEEFAPAKWWDEFGSYQGMYVVAADATCYDYQIAWKLSAEKYAGILEKALQRFAANPPSQATVIEAKSSAPTVPDPSTSVLRVFSRIRPVPADCSESNRGVGRDHMWVFEDEVQALLAAAKKSNGKTFPMPSAITGRLVRFHLLDTVRNVSPAFSDNEIRKATFNVRLKDESDSDSDSDSDSEKYSFEGAFDSEGTLEGSEKRFGMAGWLQGEFIVNTQTSRMDHFQAYGEATASGHNNGEAPEEDYPVVFAIVDAYDRISAAVPPLYYDISPVWRPVYRNPIMTLK